MRNCWRNEIPNCVHQNHVFKARIKAEIAIRSFYSWWCNPLHVGFYRKGKQTVNLASINKSILSALPISLPNIEEQKLIIREIESRLSVCDSIEQTVDTALSQADALRQSILKEAFEGRLV